MSMFLPPFVFVSAITVCPYLATSPLISTSCSLPLLGDLFVSLLGVAHWCHRQLGCRGQGFVAVVVMGAAMKAVTGAAAAAGAVVVAAPAAAAAAAAAAGDPDAAAVAVMVMVVPAAVVVVVAPAAVAHPKK